MTEESDAIAVVVSEERGEISLAYDGRIERALSPERLRVRLHELVLHRRGVDGTDPATRLQPGSGAGEGRVA